MKKLILSIAIVGFIAFGAIGIQQLLASPSKVEVVNYDKDPKKDGDKKAADTKEVKAETKTTVSDGKSCSSSCCDKSSSSKSCCSGEKSECSKSCPDKK